jgi:putative ABC transport system ATP-binding protein
MIHVRNLVKQYHLGGQTVRALDDVSLEVPEGEMLALLGASGSGKSTLMNILGCLDRPDHGSYELAGHDVAHLGNNQLAQIRNQRIGFVFQNFNLLARASALDNVELPLHYAGRRDARDKAMAALELVGLGERCHHRPNQLSGGQRQRVAIARAVVHEPAIILADEPTGALDSHTGEEILGLFQELHRMGSTIVVVTHDPNVATFCQREVRLSDGKIIEDKAIPANAHTERSVHTSSEAR